MKSKYEQGQVLQCKWSKEYYCIVKVVFNQIHVVDFKPSYFPNTLKAVSILTRGETERNYLKLRKKEARMVKMLYDQP
jgi:hypothetical protein